MERKLKNYLSEILLRDYKITFDPLKLWVKLVGYHKLKHYNKYYCGCCGENIDHCSCGAKLHEQTRAKSKRGYNDNSVYYNHMQIIDNNLLIRTFILNVDEEKGKQHSDVFCSEVMRMIYTHDFEYLFAKKSTHSFMWNWDWNFDTQLAIKPYDKSRQSNMILYAFGGRKPQWLKYFDFDWLKKLNLAANLSFYNLHDLLMYYKRDSKYMETMFKLGRFDLYQMYLKNPELKDIMWTIMRHDRKIPTTIEYSTYLNRLIFFGKDTKNIDIIAPLDFDNKFRLLEKKYKKIIKEKELQKALEKQQDYYEKVKDIPTISVDDIKLEPIKDIKDFYHYGEEVFHNCLFANKYYEKEQSYCFVVSVKDKPQECCEIIKYDDDIEINQLRGVCNGISDYHDQLKLFINEKLNYLKGVILCQNTK